MEDDAEATDLVQFALGDSPDRHFKVEWCPNLLRAMKRLRRPGIEVVLLDLGLPELDGYGGFRALKSMNVSRPPIIILTADDSSLSMDLTLCSGAFRYLIKGQVSERDIRDALADAVRVGRSEPRRD